MLSALFCVIGMLSLMLLFDTTIKLVKFLSIQNDTLFVMKESSTLVFILVDVCLLVLFMAQHTAMTSKSLKKELWPVCKPMYRSFYTIATCLVLQILMYFWQKIDIALWSINTDDGPLTAMFFTLLHVFCWIILFLENSLTEPFYLVGIKQMYNHVNGYRSPKRYFSKQFQELLSHMPHPGTTCFMIILWVCPVMTLDRWLLGTVLSLYMCKSYSVTQQDYQYTEQQICTAQYMTLSKTTTVTSD